MLGKLVRYLRLAGLDTAYLAAGDEPIEQARRTGRVLLTRNRAAARRCAALGLPCLPVRDNYPFGQAREILAALAAEGRPRPCSRCVFCNVPLQEVADPTDAEGWVPPYVYRTQRAFKKCTACGRFFWDATQKRSVDRLLKSLSARPGKSRSV
jgi:uncharacterized protein with PIN domain